MPNTAFVVLAAFVVIFFFFSVVVLFWLRVHVYVQKRKLGRKKATKKSFPFLESRFFLSH